MSGKPTYEELEFRVKELENEATESGQAEDELTRDHNQLEELIRQRTAELTRANAVLKQEVAQRRQVEEALHKLKRELRLRNRIAEIFLTTLDDKVYGEVLEVVLEAMKSKFGTFAYINEKGERVVPSMTRGIWDRCKIRGKSIVFPRETWGSNLWARCIIEKKAISSNGPFKVPEGHVTVTRAIAVPIIHRGEVVGNFMVGNKATDYDERDIELFKTIADHVAPILNARLQRDIQLRKRARAEEELRKARDELEMRVQERTEELAQAYEVLWETQHRYKELWDHAPVAYHTLDTKGTITRVNETEMDMLGFSRDEMVGKPIFDFILPEQRKEAKARFRLKIAGKRLPKKDDRIYLAKDGSKINVSIDDVLEYATNGEVVGIRTTMVDVTEKKLAEEALQRSEAELRSLSSRLLEVQENERRRISRELHDSIGQALAATKFGLENAVTSVREGKTEASIKSLESLIPLVQEASEDVRRIHADLRPSLLDDLGIISTISWFCREFEGLYAGIRIESDMNIEENEVPEPLKIVIFRILQEALNNVAKHSGADLVRISTKGKGGKIDLVIEDNGKGFDVADVQSAKSGKQGVGLMSMKERAELSGGFFAIESTPGSGTTILASWQEGASR